MIQISPPRIKIINIESQSDESLVLVDSRSPSNLNSESRLSALRSFKKTSEIDLKLSGFDFVEISCTGEKFLSGNVHIRQLIDGIEVLTLINTPKYLLPHLNSSKQEQATVKEFKKFISQLWSSSFSEALDNALKQKSQQINIENLKSLPSLNTSIQKTKWIVASIIANKKSLFYLSLVLLTIGFNAVMWKANTDGDQLKTTQMNLKSAEQMAVEQDQILNNAFKEIGIDREKLASDMSCFTE